MTVSPHIILLIGQKGSGKSHMGMLIERKFGIPFIRVEDWARQIRRDRAVDDTEYVREVFARIEAGIRESLQQYEALCFESTGLGTDFEQMLESLRKDFRVVTIGVRADAQTCLKRVQSRDASIHIPVSDDQVESLNRRVRERDFPVDFVLENEAARESELLGQLGAMLGQK